MAISFSQSPPSLSPLGTTAFFSFLILLLPLTLLPSPVDSRYLFSTNSTANSPSASASPPLSPIPGSPPSAPISGSPAVAPISGSPALSPSAGSPPHSPANAPGSSPSPGNISSLPAPTPGSGDVNSPSPMTPALPPMTHEDERIDDVVRSDGSSRVKKAGIAVVVIVAAVAIVLGAVIYKKRQDNIRRSRYIQAGGLEMR